MQLRDSETQYAVSSVSTPDTPLTQLNPETFKVMWWPLTSQLKCGLASEVVSDVPHDLA